MPTDAALTRLAAGAHIGVIRLRSLGDCVLTTPALRLLKSFRPDCHISVVVDPPFADVFAGNPDIDQILPPKASVIRSARPDLVLNLHGGTRSVLLTRLSGARWRAGFAHHRYNALYNVLIPRAQDILRVDRTVHTAEHLASAMFHLGVPQQEIPRARLFAASAERSTAKPYAVLHPVASLPTKTWPAKNFLAIAAALQRDRGLEPVFIAGPGENLSAFAQHQCITSASLENTKTLLAGASLFVGNDSGPAHMAAAFGLPVVVVFGPSNPSIWSPWKTNARVLHNAHDIAAISAASVLENIRELVPAAVHA